MRTDRWLPSRFRESVGSPFAPGSRSNFGDRKDDSKRSRTVVTSNGHIFHQFELDDVCHIENSIWKFFLEERAT